MRNSHRMAKHSYLARIIKLWHFRLSENPK